MDLRRSFMYVPASGSQFAVGNTTATDNAGNTGTKTFTVVVRDTIAPVIASTPNVNIEAVSSASAPAYYNKQAASDVVDGRTTVSCNTISGSIFTIAPTTTGITTVTYTSTDVHSNKATSSFKVYVHHT